MKRSPKRPPKRPKAVEVDWIDSENYNSGQWVSVEAARTDYRERGLDTIRSLGFVVDDTDTYLLLAACLQFDDEWRIPRGARFFAIPKGCIRRIRTLKI